MPKIKILVIEDDPVIIHMNEKLLGEKGYQVILTKEISMMGPSNIFSTRVQLFNPKALSTPDLKRREWSLNGGGIASVRAKCSAVGRPIGRRTISKRNSKKFSKIGRLPGM